MPLFGAQRLPRTAPVRTSWRVTRAGLPAAIDTASDCVYTTSSGPDHATDEMSRLTFPAVGRRRIGPPFADARKMEYSALANPVPRATVAAISWPFGDQRGCPK